jgi:hypothetical protein
LNPKLHDRVHKQQTPDAILSQMNKIHYFPPIRELGGIALGYWLDDRGFESRQGLGIFLFTTVSRPVLGPIQPLI